MWHIAFLFINCLMIRRLVMERRQLDLARWQGLLRQQRLPAIVAGLACFRAKAIARIERGATATFGHTNGCPALSIGRGAKGFVWCIRARLHADYFTLPAGAAKADYA